MKTLYGARIWARWEGSGAALYEYQGPYTQNGITIHKWTPYRRKGVEVYFDDNFLLHNLHLFRPFCINTGASHAS